MVNCFREQKSNSAAFSSQYNQIVVKQMVLIAMANSCATRSRPVRVKTLMYVSVGFDRA